MPDLYVDGSWTGARAGGRRQVLCPADGTVVAAVDEATPEDEEMLDWVRADAETALRPLCRTRMGVDDMAVVDPATIGVHGVEELHVVDGSVFLHITNGNIDAPVMMVAEKTADLIADDTALVASGVPFSRHRGGSGLYPPGDRRNGVTHEAGEGQP